MDKKTAVHFKAEQTATKKLEQLFKDAGIEVKFNASLKEFETPAKQLGRKATIRLSLRMARSYDFQDEVEVTAWIGSADNGVILLTTSVKYNYVLGEQWYVETTTRDCVKNYSGPKPLSSRVAPEGWRAITEATALKMVSEMIDFYKAL
jgi:hypothetical protein